MAIKWLIKGVDSKGKKDGKTPADKRGTGNRSKKGKPQMSKTDNEDCDAELLGGGPPAQFHKNPTEGHGTGKKKRTPRNGPTEGRGTGAETKAKRNKKAK